MKRNEMLEQLDRAGEWELNTILQRILKRYAELFPEEELFFSLPKNDQEERKRIIDALYDKYAP